MRVWLTNKRVAWEIPPGRIARFYLRGAYVAPDGWRVTDERAQIVDIEIQRRSQLASVMQKGLVI